MRVVHYLNQFFAGFGREDAAGMRPQKIAGAVGPGRGLGLDVVATLACGDDFFGEFGGRRRSSAPPSPRTGRGRCAGPRAGVRLRPLRLRVRRARSRGRSQRHPLRQRDGARQSWGRGIRGLGVHRPHDRRRSSGCGRRWPPWPILCEDSAQATASAVDDGTFLPRHLRLNRQMAETGAASAIELLLAKLGGETRSEVEPQTTVVQPSPPVIDLATATLAIVTESGCVPTGNPDRLTSRRSHTWLRYPLDGIESLDRGAFETVHGGYDRTAGNEDPNRLVPLDALRALEHGQAFGRLHPYLLHDVRRGHLGGELHPLRPGDRSRTRRSGRNGRDLDGHVRDRNALRVNASERARPLGLPNVVVTALPSIARLVGANRVVRGIAMTNPTAIRRVAAPTSSHCALGSFDERLRCSDRRRAENRLAARRVSQRRASVLGASLVCSTSRTWCGTARSRSDRPSTFGAAPAGSGRSLRPSPIRRIRSSSAIWPPEALWAAPRPWWTRRTRAGRRGTRRDPPARSSTSRRSYELLGRSTSSI